ncbi:MAG TPA: lysophospholipid acyltransferase family protein [Candidatus Hydrogenedentes bacterium]|nr:lysophospholipid acyltransferase family protein [Candidatus Hydrogenedentota bacterium]HPG70275.1 lysophospholipid acyltransferase family protein [Candidatus Hydrogenedentota bacterium]
MVLRFLRRIERILLAGIWTLVLFALRLLTMPVGLVSPRLDAISRRFLIRVWGHGIAQIIGMRVIVKGKPPKPPYFVVSNHLSHADGYLFARTLGCVFVVKGDVARWPVVGFLMRSGNVVFINREKRSDTVRVNEIIRELLADGEGVLMFAESTTSPGKDMLPFKTSLFAPAAEGNIPVHYATVHYQAPKGQPPASEWIGWWRMEPFFGHMWRMIGYPGFTATLTFGSEPIACPDRKELARKLWEACKAQFTPVE